MPQRLKMRTYSYVCNHIFIPVHSHTLRLRLCNSQFVTKTEPYLTNCPDTRKELYSWNIYIYRKGYVGNKCKAFSELKLDTMKTYGRVEE
jgi:hypothetical protein